MRILVVEDDPLLGDAVRAGLRQRGFDVDWVRDGIAAEVALRAQEFAAVVLDLGLPRLDGLRLLEKERAKGSRVPVLVLTARDAIGDRVKGFDTGADDYVVKPVDLDELAARLRALVRRARGDPAPVLEQGPLRLDPAARTVVWRGRPVELQAREFNLLHELMLNAGRVLSREQIEARLYAWGEEVESNAVEVHVHHLRRKLAPELIRTVRGVGYVLPREAGNA
ncbi:MAG TPA: response regulator transcription factor [Casimicrobiaceae bacterium]|jgi:two-component system OmpR family response regulator/two-component system response regulator QseB|nr:response regulator transcription factor [Casimicrobiaceae bacterium]